MRQLHSWLLEYQWAGNFATFSQSLHHSKSEKQAYLRMFITVISLLHQGFKKRCRCDQCLVRVFRISLSALFRMMLANYLGRKGRETCLKGVVVFSAGWDVFECTASLEKPLDRFLFNSYLTSCLQASVHRSAEFPYPALARFSIFIVHQVLLLVSSVSKVSNFFANSS